jgi:hypothetical protein
MFSLIILISMKYLSYFKAKKMNLYVGMEDKTIYLGQY